MKKKPPVPVCMAFLTCRVITNDVSTQEDHLIGLPRAYWTRSFPGAYPLTFFIRCTSAHGEYALEVQLQNSEGNLEWLRDVVRSSNFKGGNLVRRVSQGGEKNDGNLLEARIGLQSGAHRVAAHAGHVDVEENEIGRILRDGLKGLTTIHDGTYVITVITQHAREKAQILYVSSTTRMLAHEPAWVIMVPPSLT